METYEREFKVCSLVSMQGLIQHGLHCGLEIIGNELSHKILPHHFLGSVPDQFMCIFIPHGYGCSREHNRRVNII